MTPIRYSPRGEAEAEVMGMPALVWQGIPGERARVRIEHHGQNQILTRWLGAARPAAHRVEPRCDKYQSCGGCPLMHLDAEGQRDARRSLVRDALDFAGLGDVAVGQLHDSPGGVAGFRHVVKVAVGHADTGRIRVGAWGRRNRHVIPIPECEVAAPVLRKAMAAFAHHVIEMELHPFESESGRGVLRVAVMRASRTTGEVLVTLVASRHIPLISELAERLAESVPEITGVWLHLNDGPGNAIFVRDGAGVVGTKPLLGKDCIEEKLNDVVYRIGSGDFFQTNPGVAEILYRRTIERLRLEPGTAVVDLYSGVGGMALQAARVTGWALGIEEIDGAVQRSREAAQRNRISAEFVAGRVEEVLPDVARRIEGARPALTVNPARRGLEPGVVDGILSLRPSRVAYVSCNPRAMARDLALFRAAGFEIGEIELFDMFPNTGHVECLAVLDGPASDEPARRAPRRRVAPGRS